MSQDLGKRGKGKEGKGGERRKKKGGGGREDFTGFQPESTN